MPQSEDDFGETVIKPYRTIIKNGTIREFFRSNVPADLYDEDSPDYRADMNDYAILQAREQAHTYRIPCNWMVARWDGDDAIVLRMANLTREEIEKRGH